MSRSLERQWRLLADEIRVRWHLQKVERQLRRKDVGNIPDATPLARRQRLDALHHYWRYERIPRNYHYDYSIPCFVDRTGGTCAVAHLLIDSGHSDIAQLVASTANDAYVEEMDFPELAVWAKQHGLTKDELALIQPSYCPAPADTQFITTTYAIYLVAFFVMLAGIPFAGWNFFKGLKRNLEGNKAVKSSVGIGILLVIFAVIIALQISSGHDVLFDMRVIDPQFGFDGQPCEEAISHISYRSVWMLAGVGLLYWGSAGWRVYRWQSRDVVANGE